MKGPLHGIALLLTATASVAAQSSGLGEETTFEHVAPFAPWITIVLLLAAGVFVFGLYLREHAESRTWVKFGLATLRFILICLVIWMMFGYTIRPFRTDLPDLLLIVDNSESMSTVDAETSVAPEIEAEFERLEFDEKSRLNYAKTLLLGRDGKIPNELRKDYQPRLITLDSAQATEVTSEAVRELTSESMESPLGDTLRSALQRQRGRPVAAIVYMTDGVTTRGPPISEISRMTRQRNIPIHAVGLGSKTPARDLRLSDLLVDDVVFVGDVVNFDVTLSGEGFPAEDVKVTLRRADVPGDLDTESTPSGELKEAKSIRLTHRVAEKGKFDFIVEVESKPGEATTDNNQVRASVEVREERTRVLLAQAYPGYEYHFLKTLLEREQNETRESGIRSIEFSVFLQEADSEMVDIDPHAIRDFPSREELFDFDVVIFGDVDPSFLAASAMTNLRDFVRERGRGFIGIAGPRYFPAAYADTPLAEILPFEVNSTLAPPQDIPIESGYRPVITELGDRMPSMQLSTNRASNREIWSSLPELYWLLEVDELKPGVRVLAEHAERTNSSGRPLPVTTLSYVGAGKVLFQNTDESWRWRIGRGDEYFGRYWRQSIRYLSRFKLGEGRDIELTTDRETYRRGEIVRLRARFFDERLAPDETQSVVVMLEDKQRGQRRIELKRESSSRSVFVADVANVGNGAYHAWLAEPTSSEEPPATDFIVESPNAEMSSLELDDVDLRKATELTGGKYYNMENAHVVFDELPVGKQIRIEPLPPIPIWNSWQCAAAFIVILLAEWILRRQVGMV